MSNLRIEVKSKKEADELKKLLSEIFEIKYESKLYDIENSFNYYIDLKVEKKERVKIGRKNKFTPMEEEMIKMYRVQGKTITELAEMFKCSRGLIHKIIKR